MANPPKTQAPPPDNDFPVLFGMTDYFKKNILPLSVSGGRKTISKRTPKVQNESMLIILVNGGSGKLYVNCDTFELKRGVLLCLGVFHNYFISPNPGCTLEYSEVHINDGAYMYFLSCPYIKVNQMVVPPRPLIAKLDKATMAYAEQDMDEIRKGVGDTYYKNKLNFLHVMELFGILLGKSNANKLLSK